MLNHCFITENHTSYELLITSIFENLEEFDDILNASPLLIVCEDEQHLHYYKKCKVTLKINSGDAEIIDIVDNGSSLDLKKFYSQSSDSNSSGMISLFITVKMDGKDITRDCRI